MISGRELYRGFSVTNWPRTGPFATEGGLLRVSSMRGVGRSRLFSLCASLLMVMSGRETGGRALKNKEHRLSNPGGKNRDQTYLAPYLLIAELVRGGMSGGGNQLSIEKVIIIKIVVKICKLNPASPSDAGEEGVFLTSL